VDGDGLVSEKVDAEESLGMQGVASAPLSPPTPSSAFPLLLEDPCPAPAAVCEGLENTLIGWVELDEAAELKRQVRAMVLGMMRWKLALAIVEMR
jgi:hypothetical protein